MRPISPRAIRRPKSAMTRYPARASTSAGRTSSTCHSIPIPRASSTTRPCRKTATRWRISARCAGRNSARCRSRRIFARRPRRWPAWRRSPASAWTRAGRSTSMPQNEVMRATVVGAGVAGLTTALTLAERGANVTLLERSREIGGNASWLAGGMLAPFCEGESAPQSVVELGQGAIDWWDARVPGVTRKGTLVVAPPRDTSEIDRFAARTRGHVRVDEERIAELEPDLAGRFRKGLFFAGEGHLDPRVALAALIERLRAKGGEIRFGMDGEAPGEADVVMDCRGWAAR